MQRFSITNVIKHATKIQQKIEIHKFLIKKVMKKYHYTWSEESEALKKELVKAVKMSVKQINREYLIKLSGEGYNQLIGVGSLLEIIGLDKAVRFISRANKCLGDVCKCKVYGGVQVSFYIH